MFVRVKMPDGTTRRYEESLVPACGVIINARKKEEVKPAVAEEIEVEAKAVTEIKNKAITKPKTKKGSKK
jgi:predicted small metal-binding protein